MKVKQLMKHFWYGASNTESIILYGGRKPLSTITDECFREGKFGDYENATVEFFLIDGDTLRIYLKPDR